MPKARHRLGAAQQVVLTSQKCICFAFANIMSQTQMLKHFIAVQESEELHADPKVQKARFPSPSSSFWGLQDSDQLPPTPVILKPRPSLAPFNPWGLQDLTPVNPRRLQGLSHDNPWGLQEVAPAVMHISEAPAASKADVSYTPVEAFKPLEEVRNALSVVPTCQ